MYLKLCDHVLCRTALHWACKRGHKIIVHHLLENGADVNLKTLKGETPAAVTTSSEILTLLGSPTEGTPQRTSSLPFVPHYLEHPPFPYSDMSVPDSTSISETHTHTLKGSTQTVSIGRESIDTEEKEARSTDVGLTVKVRVCGSDESDFVEMEVPALTYSALLRACCEELDLSSTEVAKIRKLPNVLIRKDKDVQRMKEGQELEIVRQLEETTS